jgi:hypothetical protein
MALEGCAIVMDPGQPDCVQYAVSDLRDYLREITGNEVPIATAPGGAASVSIVIGPHAAEHVGGPSLLAEKLRGEGYVLKSLAKDGKHYLVAAGAAAQGTKYAVGRLMKLIRAEGKSAFLDAPADLVSKPSFAKRGMHFNGWAFRSPYTFRGWREDQWQRYLDILSYQGVNLFFLWPFMEIMPVPLSQEDRAYLDECRRVVDYAQKKHGMEVWIMQCTNRVAKDRCGVADPRRRPYWRPSQEDLNPGNPQHFQAIMASREALYRVLDNVDGVCNIDSDPGYYAGSPLSDYLTVLEGCRALLDCHNIHGKKTRLVHWMWCGWGLPPQRFFDPKHQAATILGLRRELAEPWWLVNGRFEFLPLCRQQGVLGKTVLLPYGVIEGEPSYPATNVEIDRVRAAFDDPVAKYPELGGVMGNVQTPLLQMPHVYFYTSGIWDLDCRRRSEKEVLLELATHLYPEHRELMADCYLALKAADPAGPEALASRLERLIAQDRLGRPGVFGRKLFPDRRIVATTLLLQLRLRAAQERLVQASGPSMDRARCAKLVRDYFDAYLAWDTAHGWHSLWGWNQWPLGTFASDRRFPALAAKLRKALGSDAAVESCFEEIGKQLASKYGEKPVKDGCIAPLKSAVLAAPSMHSPTQEAKQAASVAPDPGRNPAGAASPREWFVARPLTPEGSFTAGIEGPACDKRGDIFAVNFQREGTIGRVTPEGKAEVFVELPAGSVGNGIRFDRPGLSWKRWQE